MRKPKSLGSRQAPSQNGGHLFTDADALRALAWIGRGKPGAATDYDDAVCQQNEGDIKLFKPARYAKKPVVS